MRNAPDDTCSVARNLTLEWKKATYLLVTGFDLQFGTKSAKTFRIGQGLFPSSQKMVISMD